MVTVLKQNAGIRLCGDFKETINPNDTVWSSIHCHPLKKYSRSWRGVGISRRWTCAMPNSISRLHQRIFSCLPSIPVSVCTSIAIFVSVLPQLRQCGRKLWIVFVLGRLPVAQCHLEETLIAGAAAEQHLQNTDKVMSNLAASGLLLNKDKCFILSEASGVPRPRHHSG